MRFYKETGQDLPTVIYDGGVRVARFAKVGKVMEFITENKELCALLSAYGYKTECQVAVAVAEAVTESHDYAVMKDGVKRAVRVFDDKGAANNFIDTMKDSESYLIKPRARR